MVPARGGDDASFWNVARQHVVECPAELETARDLRVFKFEMRLERQAKRVCLDG